MSWSPPDIVNFPREMAIAEEVWEWLKDRNLYHSMGRRVSMARYGASLYAAQKHQGLWRTLLWER